MLNLTSNCPRLMLTACGSGSGKTTVACALLRAFSRRGVRLSSFKCGPDYIDPMFHAKVLGVPSSNLDSFFFSPAILRGLLARRGQNAQLCVLEGVMGYYDGIGESERASSYEVARLTKTPAVLVVPAKGMALSAAGIVKGMLELREDSNLAGVILNGISPMLGRSLAKMIQRETGVRVYGTFPPMEDCSFESRHLGLVTAGEIQDIRQKLDRLADAAQEFLDLDGLFQLAQSAVPLSGEWPQFEAAENAPTIAVARDDAFCFYYPDALELLQEAGARLEYFSPLAGQPVPEHAGGLLLGGGYPELYAAQLSGGNSLGSIRQAVLAGMPCIAECGGFMVLHQRMQGANGESYPMAGVIEGECRKTQRLQRFGYVTLTAKRDTFLLRRGEQVAAHEFHYWDSTYNGEDFVAQKPSGSRSWECIHARGNLLAGYPHIHFLSNWSLAPRFVSACRQWEQEQRKK